ncbi:MAG: hypothetical protein RL013_1488 [Bacteroidota bacterium]|jgi:predicted CopG family antitoxin
MQLFGDFFPKETKEQLANENFQVGSVLKYYVDFTTPPKVKRLIIIGFDTEKVIFASVLINSEINPNVFQSKDLQDLHISLNSTGRDYLSHSSFVDCSNLIEQDIASIKKRLSEFPDMHIGSLSEEDLNKVKSKIKDAKTISLATKKKYNLF